MPFYDLAAPLLLGVLSNEGFVAPKEKKMGGVYQKIIDHRINSVINPPQM